MYINSLGMGGITSHTSKNNGIGTAKIDQYDYDTVMQKAMEKRNTAIGSTSAADGDMIITQPSCYQKNSAGQSVSEKEKQAMSMSEYRQWFRNEAAGIQTEAYPYSPYLSDTLVIKEEAFEKMKSDPEWEKEVLDKIREHCYGKTLMGSKAIGYQIIGASRDACHEEGIPVKTNYAGSLYAPNSLLTQSGYWNTILAQAAYGNVLNGGLSGSLLGNFLI